MHFDYNVSASCRLQRIHVCCLATTSGISVMPAAAAATVNLLLQCHRTYTLLHIGLLATPAGSCLPNNIIVPRRLTDHHSLPSKYRQTCSWRRHSQGPTCAQFFWFIMHPNCYWRLKVSSHVIITMNSNHVHTAFTTGFNYCSVGYGYM